MRIVSLLPSLTELVCSLGRGDDLVGITHECDYPPDIAHLPRLTRSRIDPTASSAEIDRAVAESGGSLYELDASLLADLKPDLILTQEQCDVCAVNEATVRRTAAALPGRPRVESVNPVDLASYFAMVDSVASVLDAAPRARAIRAGFDELARTIADRIADAPRRRVALVEWLDPPFTSGHWNPELVGLAGGDEILARPGERSRRTTWAEIGSRSPGVILLSPCGYTLDQSEAEWATLLAQPDWKSIVSTSDVRVVLVDGSAYFSRPGPRLLDSLAIAAEAIHPESCSGLASRGGFRRIVLDRV